MRIDTGGRPAALRCPRCGRRLAGEDIVYKDETLRPVGCEYCVLRLFASDDVRPAYPYASSERRGERP